MKIQSKLAMVAVVAAGSAWAAAPQQLVIPPALNPVSVPSTVIDLYSLQPALQATIPAKAVAVALSGDNIGLGGLPMLHPTSVLTARVTATNSTGTVAPPGTYQVVFNATNVGAQGSLVLTADNGAAVTCALAPNPGYSNFQSCSMTIATAGAAFAVTAHSLAGMPQLEIRSVQVFKLQ